MTFHPMLDRRDSHPLVDASTWAEMAARAGKSVENLVARVVSGSWIVTAWATHAKGFFCHYCGYRENGDGEWQAAHLAALENDIAWEARLAFRDAETALRIYDRAVLTEAKSLLSNTDIHDIDCVKP